MDDPKAYIDDATRQKVRPYIIECMESGQSVDETTRKLVEIFGFDREHAKTIAWTESGNIITRAAIDSFIENGVPALKFSASQDCCPICKAMDGKVVPMDRSHDVSLPHTRCRCCWQPFWPDEVDLAHSSAQQLPQPASNVSHSLWGLCGKLTKNMLQFLK